VGRHIKNSSGFIATTSPTTPQHQKMGKSRAQSDPSYEGRLSLAIDAFKNQKTNNLRHTARLYDVSLMTLQRRLKGSISASAAGIPHRKLTPIEEDVLRSWIISLERRGAPLSCRI
jgi:hypothetical protein